MIATFARMFRMSPPPTPVVAPLRVIRGGSDVLDDHPQHLIPVYPASDPGFPAIPVEDLLHSQSDLIERIVDAATLDDQAGAVVRDTIRRFAAYVHLLPASRTGEFPGNGGLFRLGLEVGFYSLRSSHGVVFGNDEAFLRIKTIPRWRIATMMAGMLIDAYRSLTLMQVTTDAGVVWNPYSMPLTDFLVAQKTGRYYIKWRPAPENAEGIGALVCSRIIPRQALEYFEEGSPQIIAALMAVLGGKGSGPLGECVVKTRKSVIDRDRERNPNLVSRPQLGSHLEAHLLDAMRTMLRVKKWLPNKVGQSLWYGPDGLFMLIGTGWRELYAQLVAAGHTGIPTEFSSVAGVLQKAGVIEAKDSGYVWQVKPEGSRKGVDAIKFTSGIAAFGDAYRAFKMLDSALIYIPAPEVAPTTTPDPAVDPVDAADQALIATSAAVEVSAAPLILEDDLPDLLDVTPLPEVGDTDEAGPDELISPEIPWDDAGDGVLSSVADPIRREAFGRVTGLLHSQPLASFLETVLSQIATGGSAVARIDDAAGVPVTLLEPFGLTSLQAVVALSKVRALWIKPGQQKKLCDIDGVPHLMFNGLFLFEMLGIAPAGTEDFS